MIGLLVAIASVFLLGKLEGRIPFPHPGLVSVAFVQLDMARMGVSVPEPHGFYEGLVDEVVDVGESGAVLAGPTSPEIYYLAAVANHTPLTLEHLVPEGEPTTADYISLISPSTIVVNLHPVIDVDVAGTVDAAEESCALSDDYGTFELFSQC
jgi:hypothetical protein